MATSNVNPRINSHTRSISLTSRSYPFTASVDEQLCRLRTSEATPSSLSATICPNLDGLKELYERVEHVFQSQLVARALSHEHHEKWVEDALNGSLRVLELFSTSTDAFAEIRVCVQDLETSIRRRTNQESDRSKGIGKYLICRRKIHTMASIRRRTNQESDLSKGIGKYLICRRKIHTMVNKRLASLKRMGTSKLEALDKNQETAAIISMLREVEAVTITIPDPLVSTICPLKVNPKPSGWSLISK